MDRILTETLRRRHGDMAMMSDKLARQQRAAELIRSGLEETQAYLQAGYAPSMVQKKYRLRRHAPIAEALAEKEPQKLALKRYTVAMAMDQAQAAADFAILNKNPNAYVKAVELRCKLSGLLVDRVEMVAIDLRGALDRARARVAMIPNGSSETN